MTLGYVELTDCIVTSNYATLAGGGLHCAGGSGVKLYQTTITGNTANPAVGMDVYANNATTVTIADSTVGYTVLGGGASALLIGSNVITEIKNQYNASGTVVIASGASINLRSSINPGGTGGITVLTGGCTVNGNAIPAGTYTSIDSNGQPT
jgi:hypothetical protein